MLTRATESGESVTTTATKDQRKAQRFFWCWLIAATATSIAGNVAHALLMAAHAPAGSSINPIVAAALAVVPTIVQVGATHGVHVLVSARITGAAYKTALAITVALVVFAFILSFQALHELAVVYAGMHFAIACLVPLVIDLSITGSTVSLLALARVHRDATVGAQMQAEQEPVTAWTAEAPSAGAIPVEPDADLAAEPEVAPEPKKDDPIELDDEAEGAEEVNLADEAEPAVTIPVSAFAAAQAGDSATANAPVEPWVRELGLAEMIVNEGGTSIGRIKAAKILHAHRIGTPPGTIARDEGAGFRTVKSIIARAEAANAEAGEAVPA
jgi:hypothetical protein